MPDQHFADPRLARLYDVFNADRADLDHYVVLVDELGGRRVLDLGCGTGVLALMLAERGIETLGVDPASASLDVARGKVGSHRVTWIEASATHLPVAEDVDVVLMTGNVAQVFLDDEEWAAVLRRVAAVLGPGGYVVFETRDPTRRAWEAWTPEETLRRIEDDVEGVVEAWQQLVEVDSPFVSFESRFQFGDGTQACSASTLRFRDREEIEQSLADAWLDLVDVRDAPDRPHREMVYIARKPEDPRDDNDRGWRDLARLDADLEVGRIDESEWHARVLALIEPTYLSANTPHAQSGKGGDAAAWEHARRLVCVAIESDGTFLDIGCANGLLMEDVQRWAAADGHRIEPHGVDISSKLADLARARYPQWAERIHSANANRWMPPRRYDFVRTGLDYVPSTSRQAYLHHLLDHVVAPGGRLIIGVHNLAKDDSVAQDLASWGHQVAGTSRRPHARTGMGYTIHWIEAPPIPGGR